MQKQRGIGLIAFSILILILIAFIGLGIYLVKLDNIVRKKFDGQRWDIPAKVYARPLELYAQSDSNKTDIIAELRLLGYQSANSYNKSGTFEDKGQQLFIHTRGFDFGDSTEPERVIELNFSANQQINNIRTTQPSTTGVLRLEPLLIGGIYPQHNEDRVLIKLQNVPQPLLDALIATEDRDFYQHYGISLRGTARAILSNITGGKRQGGSTLTQQLVKNFFLTPERTYKRKANEALMAILVELHYSKNEILESYLNEVNLGQNGNYSVNGYGLAAQFYFGQPLRELNTSQLAFLVGLVNGPSYYNPWKNPDRAIQRRNVVLHNMLETGKLSQEEYQREKARPLGVMNKPGLTAVRFPDFMDLVRRQLKQEYQESDLENQGLRIFTTLDPVAQTRIQNSFNSTVNQLIKRNPRTLENLQGAVIVSHPENGEIIAALGSTGNFTGFNRVIDAKRQVGSLLKPVVYMQALQSGRYNWASPIQDSAITITAPGQKAWTPKNYSGNEHGIIPMQTALANSFNLATVRLGWEAGMPTFINNLKRLGVPEQIPDYPSALLGAVNLAPIDILRVYQNFATGGFNYPVRTIRSVVDANGHLLQRYSLQVQNTIDPSTAYLVNYGLQQVMSAGTGRAAYSGLPRNLNLAGKSGTTNDARDSWFAGYSGNYLAVVWLGEDNNKPIGLTGSTGALPVWTNVMKQLKNTPNDMPIPDTVQWQWIDSASGLLSATNCSGALYIPLSINNIPRQATACALPYYQVEPSSADVSNDSEQSTPDTIEHWIRDSDSNSSQANQPDIISQGGYNAQ
ncbi:penicillin-binding protein 1B [Acinetobacter qingfengensis]|uniref:Penicillin-binding protein 1B n=1 Tax=Acinetobacter qingfengensis TaxID=1262585 RepID=A0A1E7RE21_9GAMM|nr:penicillin-binding protein 1B [Acinetobacter qingfengensis]KAA8734751.1 penicillin-binding protein 1B [Acinetobacter qingfengensis]OEY97669.1 penicillin-binding protein 1B [Acinetobacter qingfengensis]